MSEKVNVGNWHRTDRRFERKADIYFTKNRVGRTAAHSGLITLLTPFEIKVIARIP